MLLRVEFEALFLLMMATVVANSSAEPLVTSGGDDRKVCSAMFSFTQAA